MMIRRQLCKSVCIRRWAQAQIHHIIARQGLSVTAACRTSLEDTFEKAISSAWSGVQDELNDDVSFAVVVSSGYELDSAVIGQLVGVPAIGATARPLLATKNDSPRYVSTYGFSLKHKAGEIAVAPFDCRSKEAPPVAAYKSALTQDTPFGFLTLTNDSYEISDQFRRLTTLLPNCSVVGANCDPQLANLASTVGTPLPSPACVGLAIPHLTQQHPLFAYIARAVFGNHEFGPNLGMFYATSHVSQRLFRRRTAAPDVADSTAVPGSDTAASNVTAIGEDDMPAPLRDLMASPGSMHAFVLKDHQLRAHQTAQFYFFEPRYRLMLDAALRFNQPFLIADELPPSEHLPNAPLPHPIGPDAEQYTGAPVELGAGSGSRDNSRGGGASLRGLRARVTEVVERRPDGSGVVKIRTEGYVACSRLWVEPDSFGLYCAQVDS